MFKSYFLYIHCIYASRVFYERQRQDGGHGFIIFAFTVWFWIYRLSFFTFTSCINFLLALTSRLPEPLPPINQQLEPPTFRQRFLLHQTYSFLQAVLSQESLSFIYPSFNSNSDFHLHRQFTFEVPAWSLFFDSYQQTLTDLSFPPSYRLKIASYFSSLGVPVLLWKEILHFNSLLVELHETQQSTSIIQSSLQAFPLLHFYPRSESKDRVSFITEFTHDLITQDPTLVSQFFNALHRLDFFTYFTTSHGFEESHPQTLPFHFYSQFFPWLFRFTPHHQSLIFSLFLTHSRFRPFDLHEYPTRNPTYPLSFALMSAHHFRDALNLFSQFISFQDSKWESSFYFYSQSSTFLDINYFSVQFFSQTPFFVFCASFLSPALCLELLKYLEAHHYGMDSDYLFFHQFIEPFMNQEKLDFINYSTWKPWIERHVLACNHEPREASFKKTLRL